MSETTMPSQPMRILHPKAAREGYGRVRSGLIRELAFLPGAYQRLEFLRLVREQIDAMQHELGPALHAAANSTEERK